MDSTIRPVQMRIERYPGRATIDLVLRWRYPGMHYHGPWRRVREETRRIAARIAECSAGAEWRIEPHGDAKVFSDGMLMTYIRIALAEDSEAEASRVTAMLQQVVQQAMAEGLHGATRPGRTVTVSARPPKESESMNPWYCAGCGRGFYEDEGTRPVAEWRDKRWCDAPNCMAAALEALQDALQEQIRRRVNVERQRDLLGQFAAALYEGRPYDLPGLNAFRQWEERK